MTHQLRRLALLLVALPMATGCDVQPDVAEGPAALPLTGYATVTIEYRQPNQCANVASACADRVVFFGSWMSPGEGIPLEPAPGHMWVGQATNVPVNWPPVVAAHLVRLWDPHLVQTETGGRTAARLRVGGQVITEYHNAGTPEESGRVYVDDDGFGHNSP
jgi:hypothetical protein